MEYITDLVRFSLRKLLCLISFVWRFETLVVNFLQVYKAQDIGSKRGKLAVEDFLYLIRKVYVVPLYVFVYIRILFLHHFMLAINYKLYVTNL